jgi:mannose-6-phosphate isomerase-like protein (cupin superfamily)
VFPSSAVREAMTDTKGRSTKYVTMATTETKERKTEGKETVTQVFYVIKGSENRQIGQDRVKT